MSRLQSSNKNEKINNVEIAAKVNLDACYAIAVFMLASRKFNGFFERVPLFELGFYW